MNCVSRSLLYPMQSAYRDAASPGTTLIAVLAVGGCGGGAATVCDGTGSGLPQCTTNAAL